MRRTVLVFLLMMPFLHAEGASSRTITMNERVLKTLNEAQTQMDEKNYSGARDLLFKLSGQRLAFYERAQVKRMLGHVYYSLEEFAKARQAYEEALAEERLPDSFVASLLGMLGRVGLIEADYDFAIKHLTSLLSIEGYDNGPNKVMLASAYLQQDNLVDAETLLLAAIDQDAQLGQKPREQWLLMLVSCYYGQEKYNETSEVLRQIVELYPDERHLINLAAIYGLMGERTRQLSLIEALLDDGRISEARHVLMLISLFMAEGLPYKAANLMEEALETGQVARDQRNLEQLSQSWFLAGYLPRSLPPLAEAAEMADDGNLYMRLAQLHMDAYQFKQAEAAARLAIEKGGLRSEGYAWLLRGMAMAHQQQLDAARARFEEAARFDDSEQYATQWIAFVENEESIQTVTSAQD